MRVASRTGRNDAMLDRAATDALTSRSPEKLEASIRDLLSGLDNAGLREDSRDLMVALAPLHDCARRIGLDPAAVFDAAAEGASPETAQLARARGGVRAPAGGGPGALARRLFGRDDVAMSLGVLLDRRHGPHVLLVEASDDQPSRGAQQHRHGDVQDEPPGDMRATVVRL